MKRVLEIIKQGWFIGLVACLLFSLLLWFAGPYFAFGSSQPFAGVWGRLIGILLIFLVWGGIVGFKAWRARAQGARLAQAVSASAGEKAEMSQVFGEAIKTLKSSRGSAQSLHQLPWYVIIGPPGSGKTTVLVNSGLNFPLAQKFGSEAIRGVGGTRNCDWWFTDEAILLDTAGRFTTQDSDASADAQGWQHFLGLLQKYRKQQPINGVLVAMSLSDLMTLDRRSYEANLFALRKRLEELQRQLKIIIPVYLLLTKADMVAGFSEFFDDLSQDGRAQVWGTSFAIEATQSGQAPQQLDGEFDLLLERLQSRVLNRLEQERDLRRRAQIFAFPSQLAALKRSLSSFVAEVFTANRYDQQVQLRGVYFTSGTQQGSPIDRMMHSLAKQFGVETSKVQRSGGRGRAYFIEQLFRQVIFPEAGLATTDAKVARRRKLLRIAGYAGAGLALLLGVVLLSISYSRNKSYLGEVAELVKKIPDSPQGQAPDVRSAVIEALPRLNALRDTVTLAERHRGDVPLSMRYGLYQGAVTGEQARAAYYREINVSLMQVLAKHLGDRLGNFSAQPEFLYLYLKAYLMLGQPEHLVRPELLAIAQLELSRLLGDAPGELEAANQHLAALLGDDKAGIRAARLDESKLVAARQTLKQASLAALAYGQLQGMASGKENINLEIAGGQGSAQVFSRRSGRPLSEPVPALFTRKVFQEVKTVGIAAAVKEFVENDWVLGQQSLSLGEIGKLKRDTQDYYESQYIQFWSERLGDYQITPFGNLSQAQNVLALLAGPTSPLRGLLRTVEENTNLGKPNETENAAKELASQAASALTSSTLGKLAEAQAKDAGLVAGEKPGQRVTNTFKPLNDLVTGTPGATPIDGFIQQLQQAQQQLGQLGSGYGDASVLGASAGGLNNVFQLLQQRVELLPPPVNGWMKAVASSSSAQTAGAARGELKQKLQGGVTRDCAQIINGRYPFNSGATAEVPLGDFARLFAPGGMLDGFFNQQLAALVDNSTATWRWRGAEAEAIGGGAGTLAAFQLAQRIRDEFFKPGSAGPALTMSWIPGSFSNVTAVRIEVNGQSIELRPGGAPQQINWPGAGGFGSASLTLVDASGAPQTIASYQGPWALFRLLDRLGLQAMGEDRYSLSIAGGGGQAQLSLAADSVKNPYRRRALSAFRCPG